jgi:hypothetical protein
MPELIDVAAAMTGTLGGRVEAMFEHSMANEAVTDAFGIHSPDPMDTVV